VHFELPFVNTLALSIVCMGLVGSSRLYMKSHTPIELITGSIIGITPQLLLWVVWL
jgi:membrane-associated phospholipid phosphatase